MKIHLKNVRLSFPSLFSRNVFDGKEGKYEATLLIDKSDKKAKAELDKAIEQALAEAKIDPKKIGPGKCCLRDGDMAEYDGYEDHWSLKASNNKRPTLINRDKTQVTEDDELLYAGCYVNAIVDIWIQNNSYGKRVNANLYGVQFLKHGEAFGLGSVDVTNEFDEFADDDEEFDKEFDEAVDDL